MKEAGLPLPAETKEEPTQEGDKKKKKKNKTKEAENGEKKEEKTEAVKTEEKPAAETTPIDSAAAAKEALLKRAQ